MVRLYWHGEGEAMRLILSEPAVDARLAARVVMAAEQVLASRGATLSQCAVAARGGRAAAPAVTEAIGGALEAAQRVLREAGASGGQAVPMVLTVIDDGA
jgi:hypothetical protein